MGTITSVEHAAQDLIELLLLLLVRQLVLPLRLTQMLSVDPIQHFPLILIVLIPRTDVLRVTRQSLQLPRGKFRIERLLHLPEDLVVAELILRGVVESEVSQEVDEIDSLVTILLVVEVVQ